MRTMSEAEREARRKADREKSRQAVEALVSSEGWQRWLDCRRHFHRYSLVISGAAVAERAGDGGDVDDMSSTRRTAARPLRACERLARRDRVA